MKNNTSLSERLSKKQKALTNYHSFNGLLFLLIVTAFIVIPTSIVHAQEIDVSWTDLVGVSVNGNSITKTVGTGWGNSGAASANSFAGDGAVDFTVSVGNKSVMCGLSDSNPDANYSTIDYGLYATGNAGGNLMQIYEGGTLRGTWGSYVPGDRFRVERTGTTVTYSHSGVVFYTSPTPSSGPLLVDSAIYIQGGDITDARIAGVTLGVPDAITDLSAAPGGGEVTLNWSAPSNNGSPITQYEVQYGTVASGGFGTTVIDDAIPGITIGSLTNGTPYQFRVVAVNGIGASPTSNEVTATPIVSTEMDVSWTDLVGVSVNGNSITKTAGTGWGNGGAASANSFAGDGAVDFTVSVGNKSVMCGLSDSNPDANYSTIDYGLYATGNAGGNLMQIYEGGTLRGTWGSYVPGDRFRVERTGTTVTYSHSGVVFYTSPTPSSGPLLVDSAIYIQGGDITDARIAGVTLGVPDAITDLSAAPGGGEVTLNWSAPANNGSPITQYEVQYGTTASGLFDQIFIDDALPGATISGLAVNTEYQFRVIARNGIGDSLSSNVVTVTLEGVAAEIQDPIPGTTISDATVLFQWDTGWAVDEYRLYVGTTVGAGDIADSGAITDTSYMVTNIPIETGDTLYVRLSSLINGTWEDNDYTYKTTPNLVVTFQGTGSGVDEVTVGNVWQQVNYTLTVNLEVVAENPRVEEPGYITYDILSVSGQTRFQGDAHHIQGTYSTSFIFDSPKFINQIGAGGTLKHSTTACSDITIEFPTPNPSSLPDLTYIKYTGISNLIEATYTMPPPWNQGYLDNIYDIPGTDDFEWPCSISFDLQKTRFLPGDSVEVKVSTDVELGSSLVWQGITVDEDSTAKAVITPDGQMGKSASITDMEGDGYFLVKVINPSITDCEKTVPIYIGCGDCGEGYCLLEDKQKNGSIDSTFGLGRSSRGNPVGAIFLHADTPDPANSTPDALEIYTFSDAIERIYDNTTLRQVVTPDVLVDIQAFNEYQYDIIYYKSSDMGAKVDGFYDVAPSAVPLVTWTIENPDASPSTYNRINITETRNGETHTNEYEWDSVEGLWSLSKGAGLQIVTRKEEDILGDRVVTEVVKDLADNIASETQTVYREFLANTALVEEIVEVIEDPNGFADSTITTWYEDPSCMPGSCGKIDSVENPDGSWVKYEYDALGRKTREITSWLDAPITATALEARAVTYDYIAQDGQDSEDPEDL